MKITPPNKLAFGCGSTLQTICRGFVAPVSIPFTAIVTAYCSSSASWLLSESARFTNWISADIEPDHMIAFLAHLEEVRRMA